MSLNKNTDRPDEQNTGASGAAGEAIEQNTGTSGAAGEAIEQKAGASGASPMDNPALFGENEAELARHYSLAGLLKYAALPILSLVLTSFYMITDGIFIARFTSADAYAATNLVSPFVLIFPSVGFMIGSGGNALLGKLLGQGHKARANQVFSILVEFAFLFALVLTGPALLILEPFLTLQGTTGDCLTEGLVYGRIVLCGTAFFALQYVFQLFLITSGQMKRAVIYTVIAGVTNIVLDALCTLVLKMGVVGNALGTVFSQVAGGLLPMVYYCSRRKQDTMLLRFRLTRLEWKPILDSCYYGFANMLDNLTQSITTFLYNLQLMRFYRESGVIAYGSMGYAMLIFTLIFNGYNGSLVPLIAYQHGAENRQELRSLLRKSIVLLIGFSVIFVIVAQLMAEPVAKLFTEGDAEITALTVHAFQTCSYSLLVMGVAMFLPSMYTALNNGLASMSLTAANALIFPVLTLEVLSQVMGREGIWQSMNVSWAMSLLLCIGVTFLMRKKYGFIRGLWKRQVPEAK